MSIKTGAILTVGRNFVVDRLQNAGVGSLNIPKEKIYELGNWSSVETVYDNPDLSYDMESLDVTCEIEALLTGKDPSTIVDHQAFTFDDSVPLDIISPFKDQTNTYEIVKGIVIPYLYLERVNYRFGLNQSATQQYSMKGDAQYFVQGTPYYQEYSTVSATDHAYTFTNTPAVVYVEKGIDLYAYSVMLRDSTSNATLRLFHASDGTSATGDYTDTNGGFTIFANYAADYDTVCVTYGSTVQATYGTGVHQKTGSVSKNLSTKPGAVRSRDIDVYLGTADATPTFSRLTGVQSIDITRSVSLQKDEEFGNYHAVSQDYDVPDVTGSIGIKPRNPADLWAKIATISGTDGSETAGPYTTQALPLEIRVSSPTTGSVLKTFYIPDARFTIPGVQGRVKQKVETSLPFDSDSGALYVINGTRV